MYFHFGSLLTVHLKQPSAVWLLYIVFGSSRRLYIIATVADNHIIFDTSTKTMLICSVGSLVHVIGWSVCRPVVRFDYYLSFLLCSDFRSANKLSTAQCSILNIVFVFICPKLSKLSEMRSSVLCLAISSFFVFVRLLCGTLNFSFKIDFGQNVSITLI